MDLKMTKNAGGIPTRGLYREMDGVLYRIRVRPYGLTAFTIDATVFYTGLSRKQPPADG